MTTKLHNIPMNPDSQMTSITIPILCTETPEGVLQWYKNITKVFYSQNLTTGPDHFVAAHQFMDGDALAAFNSRANEGNETMQHCQDCLDAVIEHFFPKNALKIQKHYI